jgi:enoyl-CoA hydratase/carnithine racemase
VTGQKVHLDITDGLATVVLDQPPVNALDRALIDDLAAAVEEIRRSEEARAVVVTGGPQVFAAGGDVREMLTWDYRSAVRDSGALADACAALARLPMPVIAAINGYALGGGLELALAADLRVCATDAKLGFPEIRLGLIPGAGGTQRLPRVVGNSRAKDLVFTGRTLDARAALDIGLVDRVAEPGEVLEEARRMAGPFLTGPALALRAAKEAIDRAQEVSLDIGLDIERALFAGLFASDDRRAGLTSFIEQGLGKARFTGH